MAIDKFLNEMKVNNASESTIRYYKSILLNIYRYKSLNLSWTKDDIDHYLLVIRNKNKNSSIEIKKTILKKYFIWLGEENIVKHLRVKRIQSSLKREDILTTEDVNKLIESTDSVMYKALISFMFESGARIKEVINVSVDDISETDEGMIINVPQTKTGDDYRRSIFPTSTQYIRNLIAYMGIKKGEGKKLFQITSGQANRMIKEIGNKAGIEKPLTCHKFRHAQATDMCLRGYQESIIRKKLGWTADSRMLSRYTHLVDNDVIDATIEKSGLEMKHKPVTNVKTAEPMNIVDAGMQLLQLQQKNEEQASRLSALENTIT